jgi:restriction system protein
VQLGTDEETPSPPHRSAPALHKPDYVKRQFAFDMQPDTDMADRPVKPLMTEWPVHRQLLNPILRVLHRLGGSASIDELVQHVVEDLNPAEEILNQPHPGSSRTELEYRLAWARTHLKNLGLITNSGRGVWALTPAGQQTEQLDDPAAAIRKLRKTYKRRRTETGKKSARTKPTGEGQRPPGGDPDSWRDRLLEVLLEMDPSAFERLCQRILRESGFIEVEVTGRSGDGGIDGNGIIRLAGLISFTVIFQCKRYRGAIGPNVVRDFRGAMIGRADKGLLITTGGFTKDARAEAIRDGAPPIDLISGDLLVDKLKDLNLGVTTRLVEAVEIDDAWFKSI